MSDVDVLDGIFAKDTALLEGVTEQQQLAPTVCPDYDVRGLVNHVVGGLREFAAGAHGDPLDMAAMQRYQAQDPAREFRAAADRSLDGWRTYGTDREITLFGGVMPGDAILSMTMMEYLTHGVDLALATGQDVLFTDEELQSTLARAQQTLPDEYRGEGKMFGPRIDVAADAPLLTRYLAFMGRHA